MGRYKNGRCFMKTTISIIVMLAVCAFVFARNCEAFITSWKACGTQVDYVREKMVFRRCKFE